MSSDPRVRTLSLFDATMLVMGGIIGVGIFFTPQTAARLVPSEGSFFLLWTLGGCVALTGALTFAELAATFPRAGGWFVFLREAFGRFPAFLFAWLVLFVISTGAVAVIMDFAVSQIAELVDIGETTQRAIGVSLLALLTAIALGGAKSGAVVQNVFMITKLLAIAGLVFAGLALGASAPAALSAAPPEAPQVATGFNSFIRASLPVLFSYGGWQLVTYIAPNVENPQRTLPRSIVLGVAGVVVVYLATNMAFVRVLGMEGLVGTDQFAAEVARRTLGPHGSDFLIGAMAFSSLGVAAAILLATPGVYVAMAQDGLFFRAFGRLHPRTGAPVLALLIQGSVAIVYFLWGRAGPLIDAVVFAEWIFHALCGLALLRLRHSRPDLPRPFKSPLYPLVPILYAGFATLVVVGSLVLAEGETTRLGIRVLAVGALVYLPWRRFFARQ